MNKILKERKGEIFIVDNYHIYKKGIRMGLVTLFQGYIDAYGGII